MNVKGGGEQLNIVDIVYMWFILWNVEKKQQLTTKSTTCVNVSQ